MKKRVKAMSVIFVITLLVTVCSPFGCKTPLNGGQPIRNITVSVAPSAASSAACPSEGSGGVPSITPDRMEVSASPSPQGMTTTAVNNSAAPTPNNIANTTPAATLPNSPVATVTPQPTDNAAITPGATIAPYPTPNTPNDFVANYGGAVADCRALTTGDTFFWTLDLLNDGSCLYAGHWLIDHPDSYVTPIACSVSWEGSLAHTINQAWDDGNPSSDKPAFVFNVHYEGMTGGVPYGETGNFYTVAGMYLTSFDFNGVQASGSIIRIKYEIKSIPSDTVMLRDSSGYYLPIQVIVLESAAFINITTCVTHGNITVTPGKLYFTS